jgi:ribosomal protein S18 acetylase RimI-like enzyme
VAEPDSALSPDGTEGRSGLTVRRATGEDREVVRALYREFMVEQPPPAYLGHTLDADLGLVDGTVEAGGAFLAEEGGKPLGFALAHPKKTVLGYLSDLYVRHAARGRGVAAALMRAVAASLREQGFTHVSLNVDPGNSEALAIYERWGFRRQSLELAVDLDTLDERLSGGRRGESFGSIHAQTDDLAAVERGVRQFVPRLPGRSEGSLISPPRNGWITVYDEVCDRDPQQLRRLARELSDRMGAVVLMLGVEDGAVVRFVLFERGRVVDEYLSVQEYYGPLPPGEVVALAANPTLVSRLTGADPAAVRAAALHARSPDELPPPHEVLAGIAAAVGLEGAGHGYSDAEEAEGWIRIPHA